MSKKITQNTMGFFNRIFEEYHVYLLLVVLACHVLIGLYNLDELPGQWFGDISIVNDYVQSILKGETNLKFITSAGPLYFYLIAPIVAKGGSSYLLYKFLSVLTGCFNIIATYLLARSISNRRIGLATSFIMAVSFWHIVWSRLGNFNIITPGIVAAALFCFVRYTKTHSIKWIPLSFLIATGGLFIYAGTFILPSVMFALFAVELMKHHRKLGGRHLLVISTLYTVTIGITMMLVVQNIDNFASGYLGEKMKTSMHQPLYTTMRQLLINIWRTLTMLHLEGDVVFRWNVSKMPHLDKVSGVLFLIGLWHILKAEKRNRIYILIPLLLLPIPSLLPGHPPAEVPSSPRNMMIMPLVYLIVAYGLDDISNVFGRWLGKSVAILCLTLVLLCIVSTNLFHYFVVYPAGLPNNNIPYGRAVAEQIDSLDPHTVIYLGSTGWGEWGQPDFNEVFWSLREKNRDIRQRIPTCEEFGSIRSIVFFDSSKFDHIRSISACSRGKIVRHARDNSVVFWTLESL